MKIWNTFSTKTSGILEVPHQTWDTPFNMSLASHPGKRLSGTERVRREEEYILK